MKDKPVTADELLKRLHADPAWLAAEREREHVFAEKRAQNALAEAPLVADLRSAGIPVSSVWDLVNDRRRWPRSFPILLAHLDRPYPDAIRDGIARALADPELRFAWHILADYYMKAARGSRTEQGLAVALANSADDEVMPELIAFVRDSSLGDCRGLLLDALTRSRLPLVDDALQEFLHVPTLAKEATRILKVRTSRRAR
ncbi:MULTISPECIES: hypothetical protein [unclassified Bradyrhizobium]|uniref:hypothetical protein n=1 Tax=unclassified Bradyrhizobium TaxID=2631580 RepID=UPI0029169278|nr:MULTISPECIES: hypothetical protein [unclassified Bradyrhizobium]